MGFSPKIPTQVPGTFYLQVLNDIFTIPVVHYLGLGGCRKISARTERDKTENGACCFRRFQKRIQNAFIKSELLTLSNFQRQV